MVAAALHHFRRREYAGTLKLLRRGIEIFDAYREANIEIDRKDFMEKVLSFYGTINALDKEMPVKEFPKIKRVVTQRNQGSR